MKILFEHNGVLPVVGYGGTERIVYWLMLELVKLGHEVVLVAHPDSDVERHGIKLIKHPGGDWRSVIPKDIDLIHYSYTPPFELPAPVLVTIHGNGKPGELFHKNSVFVSQSHASNHGSEAFVHNGLDFSEYPYQTPKHTDWKHFMFLAKASWKVKNLSDCVKACKKSAKHLHVAGGRRFSFSRYIHSYGIIGQEKKLELLRHCDALLWPVRWHEPFGVAMVEAFSQGKPVIASSFGSMPEIITSKVGRLSQNYAEFEGFVADCPDTFRPDEIRHYAEENFSSSLMAKRYVEYYEKVIKGEEFNLVAPTWKLPKAPQDLLSF